MPRPVSSLSSPWPSKHAQRERERDRRHRSAIRQARCVSDTRSQERYTQREQVCGGAAYVGVGAGCAFELSGGNEARTRERRHCRIHPSIDRSITFPFVAQSIHRSSSSPRRRVREPVRVQSMSTVPFVALEIRDPPINQSINQSVNQHTIKVSNRQPMQPTRKERDRERERAHAHGVFRAMIDARVVPIRETDCVLLNPASAF